MNNKSLVIDKIENLDNNMNTLRTIVMQQGSTREQFEHWYDMMKSRIDEIRTLINREQG
jgi:phage shock protein A